jgi:hypothetical protein
MRKDGHNRAKSGQHTRLLRHETRKLAMGNALHQLRVADSTAARMFYRRQRSYIKAASNYVNSSSAETMQALYEYLKAAESYQYALSALWAGLLKAAPSPRRKDEMWQTMARYENVVSKLHAMRMRAFDV